MFHLHSLWWCDMVGFRLARGKLWGLSVTMFPSFGGANTMMFELKKKVWHKLVFTMRGWREKVQLGLIVLQLGEVLMVKWSVWGCLTFTQAVVQWVFPPPQPLSYISGPQLLPLLWLSCWIHECKCKLQLRVWLKISVYIRVNMLHVWYNPMDVKSPIYAWDDVNANIYWFCNYQCLKRIVGLHLSAVLELWFYYFVGTCGMGIFI